MKRRRTTNGGMLPIVLACVAVLVLIIVGAFTLTLTMSGEQKVRSVVDSAALMLAEHAPDQRSNPPKGFEDCADTSGKIGLMNINRVIGKAMLINANAEAMKKDGQTGNSEASAAGANSTADSAAKDTGDKVTDQNTQKQTASFAAGKKEDSGSGAMGAGAGAGSQPQFDSSFIHRGDESNIAINQTQLPDGIKLPDTATITTEAGVCLRGYQEITANGQHFYFVPFRTKELPHLIPTEEFSANKKDKKPLGWGSAIPNAYQVVSNGGVAPNMVSVAAAVANPGQRYKIAIPHAFVVIKLHPTTVEWKVNGQIAGSSPPYNFTPQQLQGVKQFPVQCAKLDGFGNLGNEYKSQDLFSVMQAVPGDHEKMFKNIDQRMREIDPEFQSLTDLLKSIQVEDPNDLEFFLYPEYKEKDNTDPKIRINKKSAVTAAWINKFAIPDGAQKEIVKETLQDGLNTAWVVPKGSWKLQKASVKVSGQVLWTPSTGANQNLGEIEIVRKCTVDFLGKCQ